jgi:epoxyqueuosine reductase
MHDGLRERLVARAREIGFASAAVASLEPFSDAGERARDAIAAGRMSGMSWFTPERIAAATDLRARHPWARSAIALAWAYAPSPAAPPPEPGRPRGRVAAYACAGDGADYHDVLRDRCRELIDWLRAEVPDLRAKHFIDHGWAMDRAVAERAGLGFTGKHTALITTEAGSYVLLAEILLSVDLEPGRPSSRNCGRCRACIPACPTGAITAPGVIDANRCISYLTIEHRGAIDLELRPLMGTWVLGCDLCQEACPINERLAPEPVEAPVTSGPVPHPDLLEWIELDDEEFARRFRGTAVWRTGRTGLARNCAIALGNAGDPAALPTLRRVAGADPDAVVREAATWALERLSGA